MREPSVLLRAMLAFVASAGGACVATIGFARALKGSPSSGIALLLSGAFVPFVLTVGSAITAWDRVRWRVLVIVAAGVLGAVGVLFAIISHAFGGFGP